MAVDSKHPDYAARVPDWEQMSHCYSGERTIKGFGQKYLPATEGMRLDGMEGEQDGLKAYNAYRDRAVFPDFVKQGIEAMVGIMHREAPRIELPEKMEPLREKFTANGESITTFLRRLNEYQLLHGRAGCLVESPKKTGDLPFVALYSAPRVVNWDDGIMSQGKQGLEFVILDESANERTGSFEWEFKNRFRVCMMSNSTMIVQQSDQSEATAGGVYQVTTLEGTDANIGSASWVQPAIQGRTLDAIPFVFVNTKDMVPSPDDPPLLGLSNLCLAIYRGEADFRQNLHMQGQDTFVIIGADAEKKTRLGAGARVELPREGDAKFVGVSADGLSAQKDCIDGDKTLAGEMTSRLFDSTGTSYQSGEALRIRVSAKTATLKTIALTSAEALRQLLVIIARWLGLSEADIKKIVVEPNTDFVDTSAASRTSLELAQSAQMGFPISQKSMHRFAVQQGLTVLTFEQEMEEIGKQEPVIPQAGIGGQASGVLGKGTGGSRVGRGVEDAPEPSDKE